jgi:hypothetical protein
VVVVGSISTSTVRRFDLLFRLKYNNTPLLTMPILDQTITAGSPFSFTLPAGTFADLDLGIDLGEALALSAMLADGSSLPGWIVFNPATRTFSNGPAPATPGSISIKATATDLRLPAW